MRRKNLVRATVLVCSVSLLLAGCETTGGSTATGAGIGAIAGAIIGNQSGHAWEGAAIGAAAGALAGFAIHKYKTRQTRDAKQTAEDYNYKAEEGVKLDLKDTEVAPDDVAPGDTVKATLQYAALGTGDGIEVEEARVLKQEGDVVAELDREKVKRTDGTWENTLEFKVPKDAKGEYTVAQSVSAKDYSYERSSTFNVVEQKADSRRAPKTHYIVVAASN